MLVNSKKYLIIDPATRGISGLYLKTLADVLEGHTQFDLAVSYHYEWKARHTIYFRYSDLASWGYRGMNKLRLALRAIELIYAQIILLFCLRKYDVVIYALSGTRRIEYVFLWLIKNLFGKELKLICHDVIPFVYPGEKLSSKAMLRKKFFQLSDELIVHNESSKSDLFNYYGILNERVLKIPFPIMDISGYCTKERRKYDADYFLFIGHVRIEKGIEVLLKAWQIYKKEGGSKCLLIAGNTRGYECIDDFQSQDVIVMDEYLSDANYSELIHNSCCIVMPYLRGTNSGVFSNVLSSLKPVIISKLGMFMEYGIVSESSYIVPGSVSGLASKLLSFEPPNAVEKKVYMENLQLYKKKYSETVLNLIEKD